MKKELFNLLIERILAKPDLFSTHKITIQEGLEVHTFGCIRNVDLVEARSLFKEKGYKISDVYKEAESLRIQNKLTNYYFTILYGADKDKISISTFEVGYALALSKGRYYPLKKNQLVLAYTQKMYSFKKVKKGSCGVRIQMGNVYVPHFGSEIGDIITKTLMGIEYIPQVKISYRHFFSTKNDLQAIGNMFGVKVPDALKRFLIEHVLDLYKTIKDFNQINKLCQFIAKGECTEVQDSHYAPGHFRTIELSLHQSIAKMLFTDKKDSYLITDSIEDNLKLKKRGISFTITSKKRWQEEHQIMTKLRMLAGVPEIKVGEIYKKALEGIEYPCELIESKTRLIQESIELHHCVATYAEKINSGKCAIFSIEFEGKRYTLEVAVRKDLSGIMYRPIQFRGSSNCSAPDFIGKRVTEILRGNSRPLEDKEIKESIEQATLINF